MMNICTQLKRYFWSFLHQIWDSQIILKNAWIWFSNESNKPHELEFRHWPILNLATLEIGDYFKFIAKAIVYQYCGSSKIIHIKPFAIYITCSIFSLSSLLRKSLLLYNYQGDCKYFVPIVSIIIITKGYYDI